ncbi:PAS domain S-box protein [Microcoleus sp. FACHB-1515]|uniref:PAS domain-containing sensor histidine kinase n=1 Tax=Cyanophyceae TaxID=3028117 RepID=UPI0016888703|nr:ATP-binding protein [Microcoleus sp. FACHB-1515]MBD2089577.1 PAS domain S-box protein [Microcoleus sp. FACHB-1515]
MNIEQFEQQIQEVYEYADRLFHQGQSPDLRSAELLADSFEELRTATEELNAALEELQQQNEELDQARRQIEAERSRYAELFEFAPDGYVVTSADGTIQEVNQMAAKLLGVDKRFLVGKPLSVYISESDRLTFRHRLNRLKLGEIDRVQEWEMQLQPRQQQPITVAISVSTDSSTETAHTLRWILRDIQARKQAEAQLQRIQLENLRLQEANKLKAQFLTVMSHEFRTPLNAIIGFSRLLMRQLQMGTPADMIDRIHRNGLHLLAMISDMLDLSQMETGSLRLHLEAVNVVELVQTTAAELRGMADQKQLFLDVHIDLDNPIAINDSTRLRQILVNLIINAVKFTDRGGVTVRLRQAGDDELVLSVQDTGIGIEPQYREQIFTAFQQGDQAINRRHSGTGMGLAVTRSLVQIMQGKLSLTSELGNGSTFTVKLPRCVKAVEAESAPLPSVLR